MNITRTSVQILLSEFPCPTSECPLYGLLAGSAVLDTGKIPVALSNSEGAGSVRAVVRLPGAHLYIQVLGNSRLPGTGGSRRFAQALSR